MDILSLRGQDWQSPTTFVSWVTKWPMLSWTLRTVTPFILGHSRVDHKSINHTFILPASVQTHSVEGTASTFSESSQLTIIWSDLTLTFSFRCLFYFVPNSCFCVLVYMKVPVHMYTHGDQRLKNWCTPYLLRHGLLLGPGVHWID